LFTFLGLYNSGHLALRLWGLRTGLRCGLRVASSLGAPFLRRAPQEIGRAAAILAGLSVPLATSRIVQPRGALLGGFVLSIALGGVLLARLHGRWEGWKLSMLVLSVFILISVTR
jgi:PTS system mannose-specific IID component